MAIKIAITTKHGIDLPNAYVRVVGFSGDKNFVSYIVRTWASAAASAGEKEPLSESSYSFGYTNKVGDVMEACYSDLMNRPEFTKGTSV